MITHNLGQAKRLGDEVLFLERGRLVERTADRPVFPATRDRPKRPPSSKENCHGTDSQNRCCIAARRQRCSRAAPLRAQERFIVVASTTSTEQSGLFGHLLPAFTKKTGIEVRVVALGTGQALDIGRRGDADVVFVHDRAAEEKFVAEGFGVERQRRDVQRLRPRRAEGRPGEGRGGKDIVEALTKIAAAQAPFVSRGDKSGTHAAELRYWKAAGIDLATQQGRLVPRDRLAAWARRSTPRRR